MLFPNERYFGKYEVFKIEEPLFEEISEFETDFKFKGFIDLLLKLKTVNTIFLIGKQLVGVGELKRKAIHSLSIKFV